MTSTSSPGTLPLPADYGAAAIGGSARGSLLNSLVTLYLMTLRQHLHGKRWMVMMALFLLPAGIALVARFTAPNMPPMALEFVIGFMLIPQALLPLLALIYASGVIQDELEEQTITYLLVRPIPKWALYVMKLLATITTAVALSTVLTVLTYAAIYLGAEHSVEDVPRRCLTAVSVHALAVVAYCSLFGLVSVVSRRAIVSCIAYAAIMEGLLANLPFSIRLATVIYYARLITHRSIEFVEQTSRGPLDVAGEVWQLDVKVDPHLLEHPQLITCIVVLLTASAVCTLLAALLCMGKEFQVKTPEK